MQPEKLNMFRNRLVKLVRHTGKQAKRLQIGSYRLYDHDLPEFPLCIEVYGDNLYVAEYKRNHRMTEEEHQDWLEQSLGVISEELGIPSDHIFLKLRQRKQGRLGQYQRIEEGQQEQVIVENGLRFIVNLSDYLDTGLFLDHRLTRQMVRERSAGKKVLNLFAYTGSFSVYAAAGGAEEITTVDLSKTYLSWAERNMQLNGFAEKETYRFIHADVMQYLDMVPENYYDLVVMDPPTFSNSKRMKDLLDIQRDHVVLINKCIRALKKEGVLFFSTNYTRFELDKEKIKARVIRDITAATTPFDFEKKLKRWCYLIEK